MTSGILILPRAYSLPVTPVVLPPEMNQANFKITEEAYTGPGKLINSGDWDGLDIEAGKQAAITALEAVGAGSGETTFRLRDWGVSRQRYWGCPIPIIYCDDCGAVPVPAKDLPVTLPEDVDFSKPGNPLANHPSWKHTSCPSCNPRRRSANKTLLIHSLRVPGISYAMPTPKAPMGSAARRPNIGCLSISISAASNMLSCIFSIRAFSPAR